MVTVAIVGVLSAVAIPSYNNYVLQGYRSQGIVYLLDLAKKQEHYYNLRNRYGSFSQLNRDGIAVEESQNSIMFDGRYKLRGWRTVDSFDYRLQALDAQRNDSDCPFLRVDENTLFSQASGNTEDLCSSS